MSRKPKTDFEKFGNEVVETYKDNQEVMELYHTGQRIKLIRKSLMNIFGKGRRTFLSEYKPIHKIVRFLDIIKSEGDSIACRLIPEIYAIYFFYGDFWDDLMYENDFSFVRQRRPANMKKVSIKKYPIGYRLKIQMLLDELKELCISLYNHRLRRRDTVNVKVFMKRLTRESNKFYRILGIDEYFNELHTQNLKVLYDNHKIHKDMIGIVESFLITK